jgi:lipopolysaccharide/colanic/teichoic acid biosynthesis glycosyltransferase
MVAQSPNSRNPGEAGAPARGGSPRSDRLQRACDVIVSLALSAIAVPLIAISWVLVRCTTAGPGFYYQTRVGRNGRTYRIYKVRTMYHNCEAVSGAAWSTRFDPRVTPVGRVLRRLHLDELPQLLNVLRGDMSLVGPRPERPEFVDVLSRAIPGYDQRLAVRPGVTGLAQIQLPADTDVDCVRKKLVLDQCYIQQGNFWLDVRILLGTVVYLVGFPYPTVRKLMRLPDPLGKPAADSQTRMKLNYDGTIEEAEPPRPMASAVPCESQ